MARTAPTDGSRYVFNTVHGVWVDVNLWQIVLVASVCVMGGFVQGSIGFGFGTLAAPVLALVNAAFVPAPILLASMILTSSILWRERSGFDLHGIGWAILGRLPGTLVGVILVGWLPKRGLAIGLALVVLAAVALTLSRAHVRRTPLTLFAAGGVSGICGTATSIGGPPIALVYGDASGSTLRGSLAGFFAIGVAVSLAGLGAVGQIRVADIALGAWLVPPLMLGYGLSRFGVRYLDAGKIRVAVLTMSVVSSLLLLAQHAMA